MGMARHISRRRFLKSAAATGGALAFHGLPADAGLSGPGLLKSDATREKAEERRERQ